MGSVLITLGNTNKNIKNRMPAGLLFNTVDGSGIAPELVIWAR